MTSSRRSWQKSMSKSGIETRSGLRKRSNSSEKRSGSMSVMVSRIGDQRAGARTAAGPDRDALRLRPFDEVGDDQEVAGEFHLLDDAELEFQPLAVLLHRVARRQAVRGRAASPVLHAPVWQAPAPPPSPPRRRRRHRRRRSAAGSGCGSWDSRSSAARSRPCCRPLPADRQTAPPSPSGFLRKLSGDSRRRLSTRRPSLRRWRSARHAPHSRRARKKTPRWWRPAAESCYRRGRLAISRWPGHSRKPVPVRHRAGRRNSAFSASSRRFGEVAAGRSFSALPIGPRGPPVRQIRPSRMALQHLGASDARARRAAFRDRPG